MSKNILCIDIGTSSIKIMTLNKTLGSFNITSFKRKVYDFSDGKSSFSQLVAKALSDIITDEVLINDMVLSSISSGPVITRNVTLPFFDIKKIRAVVKYEIEPVTLFSIENLIVDYVVVKKGSRINKESKLLVTAVDKKIIDEHLKVLKDHALESDMLDIDSFSLWNSYSSFFNNGFRSENKKQEELDGDIAIIDIGAGKTSINIIKGGAFVYTRSIHKAGNFITEKIRNELGVSFLEAEKIKIDSAKLRDQNVLKIIDSAVEIILREIDLTFRAYYSKEKIDKRIKKISLTGGSSLLVGIINKIKDYLNLEINYYDPLKYFSDSAFDISNRDRVYLPTCIGLGLKGIHKGGNTLDLRREEFVQKKSFEGIKNTIVTISIQAIIVICLLGFDMYYHFNIKENTYNLLKKQVRTIFKETFPEVKKIVGEVQQMKTKIKQNEEKLRTFGGIAGIQMSALDLLREVSDNIPNKIEIDIKDMTITQEAIRITGKTDSFDALDNLKKNIEKSIFFTELQIDNAKAGDDEKSIEFKASIILKKGQV